MTDAIPVVGSTSAATVEPVVSTAASTPVAPVIESSPTAPTAPAPPVDATPPLPSGSQAEPHAGAPSPDAPIVEQPVEIVEEAKAEEAPKPVETTAPELPTYTEFKLPEGFAAEKPQMDAYKNVLTKYNLPQEAGQELLEFGAQSVKDAIKAEAQRQQDVFTETRRKWSKDIDKEFGNRRDTVLQNANWVLSTYGGTKAQIKELNDALGYTGAGDHPAIVRTLHNISKVLREREAAPQGLPKNTQSVPAYDRRYGARA